MKTYLVNWDGEGSENASEFKCDSAEEAYEAFLKHKGQAPNLEKEDTIVCVWGKDDGDHEEFDAHIKPEQVVSEKGFWKPRGLEIAKPEECPQTNLSERRSTIEPTSSPLADQTQEEILNQLKMIKWVLFFGFLYIMSVIMGIIPAGVFG